MFPVPLWLRAGALLAYAAACGLTGPAANAQVAAPAPRIDAAAEPRFDILEYVVVGDTVLGAAAIERAVYAFLGPQRTAADAEGARKALEKAYQDAGFTVLRATWMSDQQSLFEAQENDGRT